MAVRIRESSQMAPQYYPKCFGPQESIQPYSYTEQKYWQEYGDRLVDFSYKDYSRIADYPSPGTWQRYNEVSHTRLRPVALSHLVFQWDFDTEIGSTPPLFQTYGLYFSPTTNVPLQLDWNTVIDQFAAQLQSGTSQDSFLMPYLLQMGQLVRMVRNPFGLLTPGWRIIAGRHTADQLAKRSANLFLEYQFGWRPLRKDIENTAKTAATILARYGSQLVERRVRCSTQATESHRYLYGTYSESQWNAAQALSSYDNIVNAGGLIYRILNYKIQTKGVLSGHLSDDVSRMVLKLGSLADKLGLTLTWRNLRDVLWEVTPFSFVVDWFYDFSKVWRPFNEAAISSYTGLSRVGYSIKTETSCQLECLACRPSLLSANPHSMNLWYGMRPWNPQSPRKTSETAIAVSYSRTLGLPPDSSTIIRGKGLSALQGAESTSLAIQRMFRLKLKPPH